MRFDLSGFKRQVSHLSQTGNVDDIPVEKFIGRDGLCALDVCEVGFVIEDNNETFKAEDVYDIDIKKLNALISALPEAA